MEEEVASLACIHDLGRLEEIMLRLPDLVESPLSVNAPCEDLQVAHKTATARLDALERLFAIFRVAPFGASRIRAVKQERKHYHFDWSVVRDEGARFENLVACHLLKWVHFEQDACGRELELRFFLDVDRREVAFVVTEDRQPILFVEVQGNGPRHRQRGALSEDAFPGRGCRPDRPVRSPRLSNAGGDPGDARNRVSPHAGMTCRGVPFS